MAAAMGAASTVETAPTTAVKASSATEAMEPTSSATPTSEGRTGAKTTTTERWTGAISRHAADTAAEGWTRAVGGQGAHSPVTAAIRGSEAISARAGADPADCRAGSVILLKARNSGTIPLA